MKHRLCLLVGIALLVALVAAPDGRADLFVPGSTFTLTDYNDPATGDNIGPTTVTFNPNAAGTSLDGGALNLSEQTLVVNPTTEWVEFYLTTTSGGAIAPNYDEYFDTEIDNFKLSRQAGVSNFIFAFTLNDVTSPTYFPGSTSTQNAAPINPPISGDVQTVASNPSTLYSSLSEYAYAYPVGGYFSEWGTNTNVNGFVMGMEVVAPSAAVPEPSTLTLFALGLLGWSDYSWRRRKRSA